MLDGLTLNDIVDEHLNRSVEVALAVVVGDDGLFGTVEAQALALGSGTELGDIVETEHHVLRGHSDRSAVGRVEDVVALEHQYLRLEYCLVAQGKVDSHLVTVAVGVERSTCQRVELDGFALDELGLEGLDTQTVQCRSTVEEHGVTLHDILEDVPDDGLTTVYNLLGALDSLDDATLDELADDEWFVELGSHQLGQTALSHLELRTDNNNRTG